MLPAPPLLDVAAFSRTWAARVAEDVLAAQVIEVLWRESRALADPIMNRARRESPELDPVIAGDLDETRAHVLAHFRALLTLPAPRARDLGDDPMGFVRRHGVRRAQGGAPLRAILQAYRTGHKSFWAAVCAVIDRIAENDETRAHTTMLLSEYLIDYTDLISAAVTDAYLEEEAKLAEERTRLGIAVLDELLAGRGPANADGWRLCEQSGLAGGRPLAVAVGTCSQPARDGAAAARALSLVARAVDAALPREEFGRMVGVRSDAVVVIVAAADAPGPRLAAALRRVEAALAEAASGVCFGVGLDAAGLNEIQKSYVEALVAIRLSRGPHSVRHLAELGVDAYLRGCADETARRLSRPIPSEVASGALAVTLRAFADANLNIKACARALGVHNNTIYHRLNRVRRLTGLEPRTYRGLSELITSLVIAEDIAAAAVRQ